MVARILTSSPPADPLWDAPALAAYLGLSVRAVYNRRHRGDLPPPIKVGASLRWRPDDVEAWLDARREDGGA